MVGIIHDSPDSQVYNWRKEEYSKWKIGRSNSRILSFNSWDSDRLSQKIILGIGNYLLKNPLLLTKFLERNAIFIIDSLLQITIHNVSGETPSSYLRHFTGYLNGKYIDHYYCDNNPVRYKHDNFEAKYLLSTYLGIINYLLDFGVNIQEAKFTIIDFGSLYSDIMTNDYWNSTILNEFRKIETTNDHFYFKKYDGGNCNIQTFIDAFSFIDVYSFLEKVKMVIRYESYQYYYMDEPLIVKPECISPDTFEKFLKDVNLSAFQKDELINLNDLCSSIQEKILKVDSETKKKILFSKLDSISNEAITSFFSDETISIILKQENIFDQVMTLLDSYLNEMEKSVKNNEEKNYDFIMQNLKQLLYSLTCEKNNEKDVIESEKEKNAPDEKFNFIITEINKLSTRIDKMEDKTNSILEQVDNYLNNCVPLNKENLRGLDAETIKKILHKKPIEKSANYYMRKAILLGMLIQLSFCSILLNQNRNSHKTLDTSNCEDSLKQDVLPYPKKISQSKIKDFDFYNRKDEAYSLEDSLNLALSLGNHFENPGSIPYYTSIYDTVPKGFSSKSGIIVSYYAFQQDGDVIKYITSLKSSQQIKEFISNHTDECQDYIWKVALYTGENEEVIQNMIKNHQVIPYEYFSYFTDYDILTFLENQTSFKHSIKR